MRRMLVFLLALAMIVLFGVLKSMAHSWYPNECCSDRDCFPIPPTDVRTYPGGWLLLDGTFVPYAKARPSPDRQYHICRREDGKGKLIEIDGKPSCFWAPMGAS